MNLDDDTRLAIKRFIALIRWTCRYGQPMPAMRKICVAIGIDMAMLYEIIDVLKHNRIIEVRGGYGGKLHYRMVEQ